MAKNFIKSLGEFYVALLNGKNAANLVALMISNLQVEPNLPWALSWSWELFSRWELWKQSMKRTSEFFKSYFRLDDEFRCDY